MSYEEQFDRIIRRKVESAQYPFDEAHWESARKMLDADRRRAAAAARSRWMWMAGAGAVVGIAVWASVTFSADPQQELAATESTRQENNVLIAAPKAAAVANDINPAGTSAQENNRSGPVSENAIPGDANENPEPAGQHVAGSAGALQTPESNTGPAEIPVPPSTNEKEPITPAVAYAPNEQPAVNGNSGWAAEMSVDERVEQMNSQSLLFPCELIETEATTGLMAVSYEDYFRKNYRKQFLWVEAGGLYNNGWQAAGTRDAKGFNAYAAAGYGRYVAKRIAVSAGLQAYHVSGIHQPFYKTGGKDYSFGSSPTSTAVTATDLVYAGIPVRIHYVFPGGAQLTAGVHANLLVSAVNRIDTTSVQNDLVVTGSRTESGVYDGMNRTNVQLSVAFAYPIARKWKLQGEYVHGVSDVYSLDQQLHGRETVNGVRIGIVYTIFDK